MVWNVGHRAPQLVPSFALLGERPAVQIDPSDEHAGGARIVRSREKVRCGVIMALDVLRPRRKARPLARIRRRPRRPVGVLDDAQHLLVLHLVLQRAHLDPLLQAFAHHSGVGQLGKLIAHAVVHFTGSVATFTDLPDGRVRVKAAGYYIAIGA